MSSKLPRVTARELIRALKHAGFEEQRQRGSHLIMRRESDRIRVVVPIHQGTTIPTGTLRSILRDAEISVNEFIELLGK